MTIVGIVNQVSSFQVSNNSDHNPRVLLHARGALMSRVLVRASLRNMNIFIDVVCLMATLDDMLIMLFAVVVINILRVAPRSPCLHSG